MKALSMPDYFDMQKTLFTLTRSTGYDGYDNDEQTKEGEKKKNEKK